MIGSKILMIVGDFSEDYEVMVPFQALQMTGCEVHAACPGKKAGETVKTAVHDFEEGTQTYTERRGHDFRLNATWAQVKPETYDALLLPGGRAPEYLRLDQSVIKCVNHFASTGKPIASICHGAQILTAADCVKGRKLTAYPAVEPEITAAGGRYVKTDLDKCCVDANWVSAPAWPAHALWLSEFLMVLDATRGKRAA
jgi:protease I